MKSLLKSLANVQKSNIACVGFGPAFGNSVLLDNPVVLVRVQFF